MSLCAARRSSSLVARALALLSVVASCGDDDAGAPCTTSAECAATESCVEERCRRTSVRDLGRPDPVDTGPSDDASRADADVDANELVDAAAAADTGALRDADPMRDVDTMRDADAPDAGRDTDASAPDAGHDFDGGASDARIDDARTTDVDDAGSGADAAARSCRSRADCVAGQHCAVARCGEEGVCADAPDCAPGTGPTVCACDRDERHTFPSACDARSAGFGGVGHDGACTGDERFPCTVGGGAARECNEHEWCEPTAGSVDRCSGAGFCEARPSCLATPSSPTPVCGCDGWSYRTDCDARRAGVSFRAGLCTCGDATQCASGYCNLGVVASCADGGGGLCERMPIDCAGDPARATCACEGGRAFDSDCLRRQSGVTSATACACAATGETGGCCGSDADCSGAASPERCYGRSSCAGAAGRCLAWVASGLDGACWDDRDCTTPGASCVGVTMCACGAPCTPRPGTCGYRSTLFPP